ncbi:MAG: glycosyltransferase family 87 protein [Candidatus Margulisiibacteriota bacterium]
MTNKWEKYLLTILTIVLMAIVSQYAWYKIVISNNILTSGYPLYSQIGVVDTEHGRISARDNKEGFVAFVPYNIRFPGKYLAKFRVYQEPFAGSGKGPEHSIGFCDVVFKASRTNNRRYELKLKDFVAHNPVEIIVSFDNVRDFDVVGLRLYQIGHTKLSLLGLQVTPDKASFLFSFSDNPLLVLFILLLGWALYQVYHYEPSSILAQNVVVDQKATFISLIILSGFCLAVIFYLFEGFISHHSWPYNTFLFSPMDRFMDFYHGVYVPSQDIQNRLNPYVGHSYPVPYFPATFILTKPFALFRNWGIDNSLYIIIVGLFFILYLCSALKPISNLYQRLGIVSILSFASYPLMFLLDRGNNEGILFILIALFVRYYLKKEYILSAILLGLAIGMKLYPIVFLILYIKDKKYKEIIVSLTSTVLFTVIAISAIGFPAGTIYKEISRNLALFQTQIVTTLGYVPYNHSLYNLANHVLGNLLGIAVNYRILTNSYVVVSFAVFAAVAYFILRYDLKNWERVLLLTITMIFLPYASFDYTLIHLYIPLLLFINNSESTKTDLTMAILFSLLLIPKNYFGIDPKAPLGVVLNPLLALAMLSIVVEKYVRRSKTIIPAVT